MNKKTRVLVTIKKDVLDPAGSAIRKVLIEQGLADIAEVRVGKIIDIAFKHGLEREKHLPVLEAASKTLLSNPIMEDFAIQLVDE